LKPHLTIPAALFALCTSLVPSEAIELQCTSLDNPNLTIKINAPRYRNNWHIIFSFADGSTVDRAAQYGMDVGHTTWEGRLREDPNIDMIGTIKRAESGGYIYTETTIAHGKTNNQFVASCEEVRLPGWLTEPSAANIPPTYSTPPAREPSRGFSVPITQSASGVAIAQVRLGGIEPQPMLVDSGCSDLAITEATADDLLAHGEARETEPMRVVLADSSTRSVRTLVIGTVSLDGHELHDVEASTVPNGANMLLGIGTLKRFGRFSIDTSAGLLVFN